MDFFISEWANTDQVLEQQIFGFGFCFYQQSDAESKHHLKNHINLRESSLTPTLTNVFEYCVMFVMTSLVVLVKSGYRLLFG